MQAGNWHLVKKKIYFYTGHYDVINYMAVTKWFNAGEFNLKNKKPPPKLCILLQ